MLGTSEDLKFIAAAADDRARLDWLDEHAAMLEWFSSAEGLEHEEMLTSDKDPFRAAVDRAMDQQIQEETQ